MRGKRQAQRGLVCFIDFESRIPQRHPIRQVKALADEVLRRMSGQFETMYATDGRPSIPPERLLKAKLLQALYSVRSDRQICERLRYDLLFQWFLDMEPDEEPFHATTFTKNLDRLLHHHVSEVFFCEVVELAREHGWTSNEHFSVDGTLIEAWASMKSYRPKDEQPPEDPEGPAAGSDSAKKRAGRNRWADFSGQKRGNDTHQSVTDPEARLLRKGKGKEARLCFGAHAVMENRNGLCVLFDVAGGLETESSTSLRQLDELLDRQFDPRTVGADKGYHNREWVQGCRQRKIRPHCALIESRKVRGIDARTTRTEGYRVSQVLRRRIEEHFGWLKTTGNLRKSRYKGIARTNFAAQLAMATCNLIRMAKLALGSPPLQPA